MKKADVIDLVKYHYEENELEFKNQAVRIANEFDNSGDSLCAKEIMQIISSRRTIFQKSVDSIVEDNLVVAKLDTKDMLLPKAITNDINGIVNAIKRKAPDINKFLFVGSPGTGKTESAKQIAKQLDRKLLIVDFSNLIDSKLGQTNKNLTKLFKEINELPLLERYIILFDEIDAIALDRINQNDVREMGRVTSTFLRKMDTLNPEVVLIATTNLFANFDKALIRRFDAVIDFDRYSDDDKVEVAKIILNNYLKQFKDVKKDIRLFKKIIKSAKKIPNPGDLRNIIRVSLAFSDPNDPNDYLKRLMKNMHNGRIPSISNLYKNGFTVREIETLTGISKSTVSRELGDQKYE